MDGNLRALDDFASRPLHRDLDRTWAQSSIDNGNLLLLRHPSWSWLRSSLRRLLGKGDATNDHCTDQHQRSNERLELHVIRIPEVDVRVESRVRKTGNREYAFQVR